jgi:hypothetical protein
MPRQHDLYGGNRLHFITASTHRRARGVECERLSYPWSKFRFCYLENASLLTKDRLP